LTFREFKKPNQTAAQGIATMKTITNLFAWSLLAVGAIVDRAKSQQITQLQLVDIPTNTFISPPLIDGAVINLATLPSGTWTIVANASSSTKSVRFGLDGNSNYRTENSAPWSMTGNNHRPLVAPFFLSPKRQSTVDHSLFCIANYSGNDR
jgi:hypothetical protein